MEPVDPTEDGGGVGEEPTPATAPGPDAPPGPDPEGPAEDPTSTPGPDPTPEADPDPDPESAPEPDPDFDGLDLDSEEDPETDGAVDARVAPPVVAVIVTHDSGELFDVTLQQIVAQDYPALSILVIDSGSAADPTARIADVAPGAFVKRLPENVGFAAAANEALLAVQGATFLLLCHDDIAPEPDVVRLLVEEAYRSNAAITGPKLVDYEQPSVLLDIGQSIDRFGVPYSGLEPGELDQEQHDSVRDVFFLSGAMTLVRADLFTELAGFDPATHPGGEDLDLCWRARLLGARVMVVPDARVRHRQAVAAIRAEDATGAAIPTRNRLRALFKAYSTWTLVRVVPIALLLNVVEAIALAASRRGARARATLGGWWWNLRHLSQLRSERKLLQEKRRIPDSELRYLQTKGSARVRHVVDRRRLERRSHGGPSRSRLAGASNELRSRTGVGWIVLFLLAVFGARDMITGAVSGVGSLTVWPDVSRLFDTFTGSWRDAALGSASPAAPVFAVMGTISSLLFGSTGFARTLIVVLSLPVGALGASRLVRLWGGGAPGAFAGALAYVVAPVGRNAIAHGSLGPLALYTFAPWLLFLALRVAGNRTTSGSARRTGQLGVALLVAFVAAWYLPSLLFIPLVALIWLVIPVSGDETEPVQVLRVGAIAAGLALVLLLPWPFQFVSGAGRLSAFGLTTRSGLDLAQVLQLGDGPGGTGWIAWALLLSAVLPIAIASGRRLIGTARAWQLALIGFALTWIPARFFPDLSWFSPDATLVPAALGLAVAIGLGISALLADVHRLHFGWRQLVAVVCAAAFVPPVVGAAFSTFDGRWDQPGGDWASTLSWMPEKAAEGDFRLLWLGSPDVLPVDPALGPDALGFGFSENGPSDITDSYAPPIGDARWVADSLELAEHGRTQHLGRLLAPAGVRYLALVDRAAPGAGTRGEIPADLRRALSQQIDFVPLETPAGMTLYENTAFIAMRALATGRNADVAVRATSAPATAGAAIGPPGLAPLPGDGASRPTGPGTVVWSQSADSNWRATADGATLSRVTAFGWSNAFVLPDRAPVTITYDGGVARAVALWIEALLWLGALALMLRPWWNRRRSAPTRPDPGATP